MAQVAASRIDNLVDDTGRANRALSGRGSLQDLAQARVGRARHLEYGRSAVLDDLAAQEARNCGKHDWIAGLLALRDHEHGGRARRIGAQKGQEHPAKLSAPRPLVREGMRAREVLNQQYLAKATATAAARARAGTGGDSAYI